jgi:uroporphyrinogen-III decarboxylase
MDYRERILSTIRGQPVDHIPWAPRWGLWFNAARLKGRLPEKYRGWHIFDVTRDLGMGIKAYHRDAWREVLHGVEVRETRKGAEILIEYDTPVGTASVVWNHPAELASQGVRALRSKYLVSGPQDYGPVLYMLEHTEVVPQHEKLKAKLDLVGSDGCTLVHTGHCPASTAMIDYLGVERFYYELHDHPDLLQQLLDALERIRDETVGVVAESAAVIASLDGNYDMAITPPPIYRKFFLPYFKKAVTRLHAAGKIVSTHVDGDNRQLLELILESGFDIGEAFTSPPMTHLTVRDAQKVWGQQMTIWGGIASTYFRPQSSREEFEEQVLDILDSGRTKGHLVLGTGDNVPTDGDLDRVRWVTRAVAEYG